MDIRYKDQYEFLDLSDLDESTRDELTSALNSNTTAEILKLPWDTGETDYTTNSAVLVTPEEQQDWQNYGVDETPQKYEGQTDTGSSIVMSAVPSTHIYPHSIMTTMYGNMMIAQPNVYVNNVASYIPGMTYSQSVYNPGNEIHEMPSIPMRGAGRRNTRGRGSKRDTYITRNINPNNEMQAGYMGGQGQYHYLPRTVYHQTVSYPPPPPPPPPDQTTSPQQHPAAGSPLFLPPANIYSTPHTHAHPIYPQMCHHSVTNSQYGRQSQPPSSYQIQESTKNAATEPYDKHAQNVYTSTEPTFQQHVSGDHNSSQTNIVTTVIVNNSKLEPSINDEDESTSTTKCLNNNKKVPPVNVKIEHNIVSTVNENYKSSEKADVPCVNINSSIEVKQEREDNKEFENETVSHIKTTVKTVSNSTSKINPGKTSNDETISKNVQEVLPPDKSDSVLSTAATLTPVCSKSWASILKKPHTDSIMTPANSKPTARINPLVTNTTDSDTSTKLPPQTVPMNQQFPSLTVKDQLPIKSNDEPFDSNSPQTETLPYNFDDPVTYRMGEFLLNYQMDKQTVSLLPRGLTNRNNYCYINSILQALLACPPFYNLLMAVPNPRNPSRNSSTPLIDNMIKFAREFSPLSAGARLARKDRAQRRSDDSIVDIQSGVAFEPSYVYTMLKNTSSAGVFSVEGRQEDAEEFLSCLLNGISDEMLEVMKLVSNGKSPTTANTDGAASHNVSGEHEEWKVMGPKNKGSITRCTEFGRTPLSDIFRGQLRSRVSRAGEQPTDNVQPFFTLQLDIEKAESVKSALEILVGKDQLEGMTCSRTKQEIEAWKQVTLEELPVILILHLKWFDYKLDGCSKILKSVDFPIDLKIDSKFLSPNAAKKLTPKQRQYKLFAVTYHDGKEATKGHYITDAFHVGYGGWLRYDDSSLKGVPETNVLNPCPPRVPYLLYYRRCDTIGNVQTNTEKTR